MVESNKPVIALLPGSRKQEILKQIEDFEKYFKAELMCDLPLFSRSLNQAA